MKLRVTNQLANESGYSLVTRAFGCILLRHRKFKEGFQALGSAYHLGSLERHDLQRECTVILGVTVVVSSRFKENKGQFVEPKVNNYQTRSPKTTCWVDQPLRDTACIPNVTLCVLEFP